MHWTPDPPDHASPAWQLGQRNDTPHKGKG
uniref:Uncharacterized protein n=1 Tax=Tetraselmis sp. GSL018 TaxID=582737 RepID=A0A061QRT8_9CHLO